jgi:hypothetical protein
MLFQHSFNQLIPTLRHIPRLKEIPPHSDGIGKVWIISGKTFDGQPFFPSSGFLIL